MESCQIGVFLGYATGKGFAFLDREIYLPQEWANDQQRRQAAGVPESVRFATKPQLARVMLERARAAKVPLAWVTGDTVYGNDRRLREWLEENYQAYVLAVACIALHVDIRTNSKSSINTISKTIKLIPTLSHPILEYKPPIFDGVKIGRIRW